MSVSKLAMLRHPFYDEVLGFLLLTNDYYFAPCTKGTFLFIIVYASLPVVSYRFCFGFRTSRANNRARHTRKTASHVMVLILPMHGCTRHSHTMPVTDRCVINITILIVEIDYMYVNHKL